MKREELQEMLNQACQVGNLIKTYGTAPFENHVREFQKWGLQWLRDNREWIENRHACDAAYEGYELAAAEENRLHRQLCALQNQRDTTAAKRRAETALHKAKARTEAAEVHNYELRRRAEATPAHAQDNPWTRFKALPASTEATEPRLLCLQCVLLIFLYEIALRDEPETHDFTGDVLAEINVCREAEEPITTDWPTWREVVSKALEAVAADLQGKDASTLPAELPVSKSPEASDTDLHNITLKDFDQTVFDEIAGTLTRVGIEYLVGRLPGRRKSADHPDPKTVRAAVERLLGLDLVKNDGGKEGIALTPKGRQYAQRTENAP